MRDIRNECSRPRSVTGDREQNRSVTSDGPTRGSSPHPSRAPWVPATPLPRSSPCPLSSASFDRIVQWPRDGAQGNERKHAEIILEISQAPELPRPVRGPSLSGQLRRCGGQGSGCGRRSVSEQQQKKNQKHNLMERIKARLTLTFLEMQKGNSKPVSVV